MDENAHYLSVKWGHSHADQNSGERSGRCSAPRVIDRTGVGGGGSFSIFCTHTAP